MEHEQIDFTKSAPTKMEYFKNLFTSPTKLAENIVAQPLFMFPGVITAGIIFFDLFVMFILGNIFPDRVEGLPFPTPGNLVLLFVIILVLLPIVLLLNTWIFSGLHLLMIKIFKGDGLFTEICSLSLFATGLNFIFFLANILLVFATGNINAELSLNFLIFNGDTTFLTVWLDLFKPHILMYSFITTIAFKYITKLDTKRAFVVAIFPQIVITIISSLIIMFMTGLANS